MSDKNCSSLISSTISNMDINQIDKKDVSKVFAFLRTKLNLKEKELLELQRAEPNLLAPDCEQIDTLIDVISSLHLSTQDGSFIFASPSNSDDDSSSSSTTVCSTGVDSIKTLPSNVWLPQSIPLKKEKEHQNEYRLPMVTHLLSLPINAYVASSSNHSTLPSVQIKDEPTNRLPMVSQLLSMPINAFKSSSNIQSTHVNIQDNKETVNYENKTSSTTESPKSIFDTEKIYSKEHWLKKASESDSESEFECISLDLDAYIQQTSDKMRRLHTEYLQAIDKLKTPPEPVDSSQMIKSMYPQMFDRIQQDMSTKDLNRLLPSKK